jgi:hypothetical protein
VKSSSSAHRNRISTRKKDLKTNPEDASLAERKGRLKDPEAASAGRENFIQQHVLNAVRKQRCPSNPEETNQYIAGNVIKNRDNKHRNYGKAQKNISKEEDTQKVIQGTQYNLQKTNARYGQF